METTLKDIVNMISLRTFLQSTMDGLNVNIPRPQVKDVQAKIAELNKVIITESLKLDFTSYGKTVGPKAFTVASMHIEASEPTENTMKKEVEKETKE